MVGGARSEGASVKVPVFVTQKDINNGVRYDPRGCPIARAVRRAVDPYARVGAYRITLEGIPRALEGQVMSDEVLAWRRGFDHGDKVKPIKFYLEVPE